MWIKGVFGIAGKLYLKTECQCIHNGHNSNNQQCVICDRDQPSGQGGSLNISHGPDSSIAKVSGCSGFDCERKSAHVTLAKKGQGQAVNILLVEDDTEVSDFIVAELEGVGHSCVRERDGEAGLAAARTGSFDVLIVDRMIPAIDGLTLIGALRAEEIMTPALVLSALGDVDDRVQGLQSGADDYLVKPFSMAELTARLEVLHRRSATSGSQAQTRLTVGDISMDLLTQRVERQGKILNLQPREYKLLEFMMRNEGQVVTRAMLLENVWGYHFDPQTNVIDVHVSRLRQKIDRDFDTPMLATVRGAGYRFGDQGEG
jgi:two-component system, OmpR family, response regulator